MTESVLPKPVVALGVTGSIAAYKAADLTSQLVQAGVDVHVLMTASACKLVCPQTFMTLSRNPVISDLWEIPGWQPGHIALADKADLLLIAPATANIIGKIAHGIADDALSTYALSHDGDVIIAPAMNPRMWAHVAVQDNCRLLRDRGVFIIEPESGRVACGTGGTGRLASVAGILQVVLQKLAPVRKILNGCRILVTAGPTREPFDPVRFISNRSSGKMGYAIAKAAASTGCDTTLISGPTNLPRPVNCDCIDVETAAEMAAVVKKNFPNFDILIMCAAVSDFKPTEVSGQKIKKSTASLTTELERTEDILQSVAKLKKPHQKIMGFAAETANLEQNAEKKLHEKKLDWIVGNDVSRTDIGFGTENNQVIIFSAKGKEVLPRIPKTELAEKLIAMILASRDCS